MLVIEKDCGKLKSQRKTERKQEVAGTLATTNDISMDATEAAVKTELDYFFLNKAKWHLPKEILLHSCHTPDVTLWVSTGSLKLKLAVKKKD